MGGVTVTGNDIDVQVDGVKDSAGIYIVNVDGAAIKTA